MKSQTYCLAEQPEDLKAIFDHPLTISTTLPSNPLEIILTNCVSDYSSKQCCIIYDISADLSPLDGSSWKPSILVYQQQSFKEMALQNYMQKQCWASTITSWRNAAESGVTGAIYVIKLINPTGGEIRLIYLPKPSSVLSKHVNLNILKIVQDYASLEPIFTFFEEQFYRQFTDYLYSNEILQISHYFQNMSPALLNKLSSISQQPPYLNTKANWLLKKQLYEIKKEEHRLKKEYYTKRDSFTSKISEFQELVGMDATPYDEISIETIRKIRQANIQEKSISIRDLESTNANLSQRLSFLHQQKALCEGEFKENQNQQKGKIQSIKEEIRKTSGELYSRNSVQSAKQPKINQQQKSVKDKKRNLVDEDSYEEFLMGRNISDADDSFQEQSDYKFSERKVANVVKEIADFSYDLRAVKQKYASEILKIDFEAEKAYEAKKELYKAGALELAMVLEEIDLTE